MHGSRRRVALVYSDNNFITRWYNNTLNDELISRVSMLPEVLFITHAGLLANQLDRVQSILNFAARLIYGRAKYDHATPILRDKLHWLRVPERIQYECCLLVYKSLHGLYISNFCTRVQLSDRRLSLRSAARSHYNLVVPRSSKFGKRSSTISSPSVWNSLPDHVVSAPSLDTFKDFKLICLVRRIRSAPVLLSAFVFGLPHA